MTSYKKNAYYQPRRFTALEILTPDPYYREPSMNRFGGPVMAAIIGFYSNSVDNWLNNRPRYAGIHKHILYATIGFVTVGLLVKFRAIRKAEHAAMLRHYVELHPEEFIMEERKKIGEVFEEWVPIR